ncbi:MAG: hypothetical protein IPK82_32195 [Polyangiaceae bacterium]|nr:hypothetical protein [Polyangiaceae bacterium]
MLQILQAGTGAFRDVVLIYGVKDAQFAQSFLWPEACALGEQNGAYALVGPMDVEPLGKVVVRARREAGPFSVRGVALVGFGRGCRAVREQIREGARPDVVVALDGVSGPPGPIPPDEYYLGPWRVVADRARRGECLAIFTHTSQVYMEALSESERFPAPITVLREITGFGLAALSPADPPIETRDGGLIVQSHPSRAKDRIAHAAQKISVLPNIMTRLVQPWLDEMDFTPTSLPRWQL